MDEYEIKGEVKGYNVKKINYNINEDCDVK
jgi:hypothetical protein